MKLLPYLGTGVFAVAVLHTFATGFFQRLAHRRPAHAGFWHLLGEVVFGLWAGVLVAAMALLDGVSAATGYLDTRNFAEPMFVFAIMVLAGSRPILHLARMLVDRIASVVPRGRAVGGYFVVLAAVPRFGSPITEPAAMTLAALMVRERIYAPGASRRLRYATLGALFVNVSRSAARRLRWPRLRY